MSVYCPKDSKVCVDDMCYSGSCLMGGGETGERCNWCGRIVFRDIEDCRCDPMPMGHGPDDEDDE